MTRKSRRESSKTTEDNELDAYLLRAAERVRREQVEEATVADWDRFVRLVRDVDTHGAELNRFSAGKSSAPPDGASELLFCGLLEGDYSERQIIDTKIVQSGGFLLRTPAANVLFDPGMGTIAALRDLGANLFDVDAVVVSHYHPSASSELHTILNMLGGFTPDRAPTEGPSTPAAGPSSDGCEFSRFGPRHVWLFASQAVLTGRSGHPSLLISSDLDVLSHGEQGQRLEQPRVCQARPHAEWFLWRAPGNRPEPRVTDVRPNAGQAPRGYLRLLLLPASHNEASDGRGACDRAGHRSMDYRPRDVDGQSGRTVMAYRVSLHAPSGAETWSLLFTGDTAYDTDICPWMRGDRPAGPPVLPVDVLVCNTKTIQYRRKRDQAVAETPTRLEDLAYTDNQLGLRGTFELARNLRPRLLVLRAWGLETVVGKNADGEWTYRPENLALCRWVLDRALQQAGDAAPEILIPGHDRVALRSRDAIVVETRDQAIALSTTRPLAGQYCTNDAELLAQARLEISRFAEPVSALPKRLGSGGEPRRPILVIEGPSGMGKTLLAKCIAREAILLRRDALLQDVDACVTDYSRRLLGKYKQGSEKWANVNQLIQALTAAAATLQALGNNALEWTDLPWKTSSALEDAFIHEYDLGAHDASYRGQLFGHENMANSLDDVGYLARPGFLILNQLEKIDAAMAENFLDVVENLQFTRLGSSTRMRVQCRMLFTTNRDLDTCAELPPDLRNRLRGGILRIRALHELAEADRHAEIGLVAAHWFANERAVPVAGTRDVLLAHDWSEGGMRALRHVLNLAREMAIRELRLNGTYVPILGRHCSEAIERTAPRPVAGRAAPPRDPTPLPPSAPIAPDDLVRLLVFLAQGGVRTRACRFLLGERRGNRPPPFLSLPGAAGAVRRIGVALGAPRAGVWDRATAEPLTEHLLAVLGWANEAAPREDLARFLQGGAATEYLAALDQQQAGDGAQPASFWLEDLPNRVLCDGPHRPALFAAGDGTERVATWWESRAAEARSHLRTAATARKALRVLLKS